MLNVLLLNFLLYGNCLRARSSSGQILKGGMIKNYKVYLAHGEIPAKVF